jgi:hypothetical protein
VIEGLTDIFKSSRNVSLAIEIWKASEVHEITEILKCFDISIRGKVSGTNYIFESET